MKVLLVEDCSTDAELAVRALCSRNASGETSFDVEVATTLREAQRRLASNAHYDLLLCDLSLPDGSGLELLMHVRAHRLPLSVVVLSGTGDEVSVVTALHSGADDYLVKTEDYLQRLPLILTTALFRYRAEAERQARPLRVLYVEHSASDVELIRRRLARLAPRIQLDDVPDVPAALRRLRGEPADAPLWDAVLVDYGLPGLNGIDAIKLLQEAGGGDLPVVLITGQGSEQLAIRALHFGAADYVVKRDDHMDRLPTVLEHVVQRSLLSRRERALQLAWNRLSRTLAFNPTALYAMALADQGSPRLIWVSENVDRILGHPADRLILPGGWADQLHPDDRAETMARLGQLSEQGHVEMEYRLRRDNGEWSWIRDEIRVIGSGPVLEAAGSWNDITARKETERRLAESEARYRLLAENVRDVIWQMTPDFVYTYVSPSIELQRGFKPEEMIGCPAEEFLGLRTDVAGAAGGNLLGPKEEFEVRCRDGSRLWVEAAITPVFENGVLGGYRGVTRDIAEHKALQARMNHLAHHDSLTGLPNRRLFEARLEHALKQAQRYRHTLAVLIVDLDYFKDVNDSFGHAAGDELLKQVAQRFVCRVRGSDTVARFGGDEFAVLLEQVTLREDGGRVACDLIEILHEPFVLASGAEVRIGASAGVSLYPDNGQLSGTLMQQADAALYHAKSEGRDTYRYFTDALTRASRERLRLEGGLRRALERNEFEVHYQPVIEISSGRIVGAEALLRWRDAEGQEISPARFIPVAESCGQILPIGEWVLRVACRQLRQWDLAGHPLPVLSVNLSARQFAQRNLADMVLEIVAENQLHPSRLELEITESALMPEGEDAAKLLHRLKDAGLRLAIDDFGTGWSSLAYLQRFPFDTLKIDRRFIQNVATQRDQTVIVRSIIGLAQSLEYEVLAEGVETEEQLAFCREHGCHYFQGFLRSPAVPAAAFERLMREGLA